MRSRVSLWYGGRRIAIVNQHHADQIDLQMTPLEFMRAKVRTQGGSNPGLALL